MYRLITARILFILAILFAGQSCVHDIEDDVVKPRPGEGDEVEVVFSVHLPSVFSRSGTRALGDTEEKEIRSLQVMVFKCEENDDSYQFTVNARETAGSTPDETKYVAKLRTGKYDLMLIANSDVDLKESFQPPLLKGSPRAGVIRDLQMLHSGMWGTNPEATGYRQIPMWGIKKDVTVSTTTNLTGPNAFDLIRAVAKVNVKVDLEEDHDGTFELTSVRFYNRRTKAQLIPKQWSTMTTRVSEPSLVEGDNGVKGPLTYEGGYINDEGNCEEEIYVLEAPAGAKNLHPDYPCIVVGGKYNDGGESFYRVDFAIKDNNDVVSYMPILRNYTYEITVKSVGGDGFTDPDDAYNSLPVNINANVVGWDEEKVGDIYFDGLHYLRLEKGRYFFGADAYPAENGHNKLLIETDHPDGWEYKGITYDGTPGVEWLEFIGKVNGDDDAGDISERWFKVLENESDEERTASVFIEAGSIRGTIKVTQYPHSHFDMSLHMLPGGGAIENDEVFVYESDMWTAQQGFDYEVRCTQPDANIEVYLINPVAGYGAVRFVDDEDVRKGGVLTGEQSYELGFIMEGFIRAGVARPDKGSFPQEALEYMFVAKYEGQTITKKFRVAHKYIDLQVAKLDVCMQGRFYDVDMDYNTDWVREIIDPYGIIDDGTKAAVNLPLYENDVPGPVNKPFRVKLNVGEEYDGKTATVRFTKRGDNSKMYDEVEVRSIYNFPNSYMVDKNGNVTFPVTKAFRVRELGYVDDPLPLDGVYRAHYIWADFDAGNNMQVTYTPHPSDQSLSEIRVQGLNGHYGSAVVALFLGEDIVWSWHIWIVDDSGDNPKPRGMTYYIEENNMSFTVMDRNLGAKSNKISTNAYPTSEGFGLHYQWGRKDPFPPSAVPNGTDEGYDKAIGDGGNMPISLYDGSKYYVGTLHPLDVPVTNTLLASIRQPYTFLTPQFEPYDWYLENNNPNTHSSDLWRLKDGLKSQFDPCPAGWRIANYYEVNNMYHYTITLKLNEPGWTQDYGWAGTNIGNITIGGYIDRTGIYRMQGYESWLWYGCIDNDEGRYNTLLGLADRSWYEFKRARVGMPKASGLPVRCETDDEKYWPSW